MDWFVIDLPGAQITFSLRSTTACNGVQCAEYNFRAIPGIWPYAIGSWVTLWGSALLTAMLVYQVFTRMVSGFAHPRLSRMGVLAGMGLLAAAAATGYVFAPEPGPLGEWMGARLERTYAPLMMIVAHAAGVLALHFAAHQATDDNVAEYRPVVIAKPGESPGGAGAGAGTSAGLAVGTPTPGALSGPLPVFPAHLKKQLKFVVLTAELSRAGIDARREDGSSCLVLWRDVVGVIARRLPPELDGATFVDLMSTAGSSLRVLAWTRFSGDPLPGTGDARARSLVSYIAAHCPDARIDPATIAFADGGEPASQLASVDDLVAYDALLA
jgi:hypothetical protein